MAITEQEFIERLIDLGYTEKKGKMVYDKLWGMLIDARTKGKYDFK